MFFLCTYASLFIIRSAKVIDADMNFFLRISFFAWTKVALKTLRNLDPNPKKFQSKIQKRDIRIPVITSLGSITMLGIEC